MLENLGACCSFTATTDVTFYEISKSVLLSNLKKIHGFLKHRGRVRVLRLVAFLSHLAQNEREEISEYLNLVFFKAGETIFREGDKGDCFYIVREGEIALRAGVKEIGRANGWNYFGQGALLSQTNRKFTATAKTDASLFSITEHQFFMTFGLTLQEMLAREYVSVS